MILFLFTCSLLPSLEAYSRVTFQSDTTLADRYLANSDSLVKIREYDQAIDNLQRAIPLNEITENWEDYVRCYIELSRIYLYQDLPKESMEMAQKAMKTGVERLGTNHKVLSRAYDRIAFVHNYHENYLSAMPWFEKALNIRLEHTGEIDANVAKSYSNLSITLQSIGDLTQASEYGLLALKIFKETLGNTSLQVSQVYMNLGNTIFLKGDFFVALDYHTKAMTLLKERFGADNIYLAYVYANMASIYDLLNDHHKAITYIQKGMDVLSKNKNSGISLSQQMYYLMASAHAGINNYDLALEYLQSGMDMVGNSALSVKFLVLFAGVLKDKKDYISATNYLHEALRRMGIDPEKAPNLKSAKSANIYRQLGTVSLRQKKYVKALEYYQKSLISNSFSFDGTHFYETPKLESYINQRHFLFSLSAKGKVFFELYNETNDLTQLNQALLHFHLSDTLIDAARASHRNYNDKVEFAESTVHTYEGAISACLEMYHETKNPKYEAESYYFLEKSKTGVLKESFSDTEAKTFLSLPNRLLQMEKYLKVNQAFYKSKLLAEQQLKNPDSLKITKYQGELFLVDRSIDSLIQALETQYPDYHALKYKNSVVELKEIQKRLDNHTTLLEYFVGDSSAYAFIIQKDDYHIFKLNHTKAFISEIDSYQNAILKNNLSDFKKHAASLYQYIIHPIRKNLQHENLIIIPHDVLWNVNFELLLTDSLPTENPKDLPYLIKDYNISYANSATLLFKEDQKSKEPNGECLAFAFSDSSSIKDDLEHLSFNTLRNSKVDLPGTRREIKSIAEILDGQYYFGSEANETNFKKEAENYSILHLALHGELDHRKPENSKLYFTQNRDSLEDNYLYSHEIFALNLPAELAVLSACNTGSGKLAKGEGVMSLGRAFQYAGTKSLLLTGWEVSDNTSPNIMRYFYKGLKDGKTKSQALREAKLKFLDEDADAVTMMPYYWGSFYILGDDAPIDSLSEKIPTWLVVLMATIMILGLLYVKRRFEQLSNKNLGA